MFKVTFHNEFKVNIKNQRVQVTQCQVAWNKYFLFIIIT